MARFIDGDKQNFIGDNLKRIRLERKVSQKQLSEELEKIPVYICRGSVSRIEHGERTVTDVELVGIAKVLRVSVLDLLGDDPEKSGKTTNFYR